MKTQKQFLKEVAENSESQIYRDGLKGTARINAFTFLLFQWQ